MKCSARLASHPDSEYFDVMPFGETILIFMNDNMDYADTQFNEWYFGR